MLGRPKYKRDEIVQFYIDQECKIGRVYIIDKFGTFEQQEEVSYDIMVETENCLYKHVRESWMKPV